MSRAVKARDVPDRIERLLAEAAEKLRPSEVLELFRHWLTVAPELKPARDEIDALRRQFPAYPTTLVLQERPADHPRPTFRHHRGEFLHPKESIEPGVPAILSPLPKCASMDRLTFARWLMSPENPLTARVTVNRHWQAFFGRGIVRTLDDFGYQGDAPTHPELLDWLAVEFANPDRKLGSAWSTKRLHKAQCVRHVRNVPAVVACDTRIDRQRSGEQVPGPWPARASGSGADSRFGARGRGVIRSTKMYGTERVPAATAGCHHWSGTYGGINWQPERVEGEDRYRRGLHTIRQAHRPVCDVRHIRRSQR